MSPLFPFVPLTRKHLPEKSGEFTYKLGIILDGELYSAPAILGVIYDRAELTGTFSQEEADDLASVLGGGALPARLRLVEKKDAPSRQSAGSTGARGD